MDLRRFGKQREQWIDFRSPIIRSFGPVTKMMQQLFLLNAAPAARYSFLSLRATQTHLADGGNRGEWTFAVSTVFAARLFLPGWPRRLMQAIPVVYVFGARKVLDDVEGWLLGRNQLAFNVNAAASESVMKIEGGREPTMEPDDAGKGEEEATVLGSVAEIVVTIIGLAIFALDYLLCCFLRPGNRSIWPSCWTLGCGNCACRPALLR
jgi:hypothetical protein